jgi:hypothetical protein
VSIPSKKAMVAAEAWLAETFRTMPTILRPEDAPSLAELLDRFSAGSAKALALDAINTCVVCECSLVEVPETPPHCLDCGPTEEHIEDWEETASRLQHALDEEAAA